jgi:hypothetical protein
LVPSGRVTVSDSFTVTQRTRLISGAAMFSSNLKEAFSAWSLGTALLWVGARRVFQPTWKSQPQAEWHPSDSDGMPQWLRLGIEAHGWLSLDEALLLKEAAECRHSTQTDYKAAEVR